ncbi:C40 family peptidase [uncultured Amnibacterium sp.]|uniref:C40 family peptidase n=1 Tax=uncultured Amnibacterium sp. TaxID=1631851 RepID=UPI0035CBC922
MSYADVLNQMQTIQSRLTQLGMLQPAATSATGSTSAASFATALDGASGTAAASASSSASTDGALVSPNGATGDDVVSAALQYKGVPYVLGGESTSGIDCSGLVQAALAKVGVSAPRLVHQQQTIGQPVDSLKDAKPGDLIVLSGGDHIAVYMGNDTVIHAPYPGRSVSVQKAWFTDKDIVTIRRVVPATDDAAAAAPTAVAASPTQVAASGVLGATGADAASGTATSGLSAATIAKATSMLTSYGGDVGLYDTSGSSTSSGGTSLSSLLASFGLTGTSTSGASSSSAQQILAARTALLGASA